MSNEDIVNVTAKYFNVSSSRVTLSSRAHPLQKSFAVNYVDVM